MDKKNAMATFSYGHFRLFQTATRATMKAIKNTPWSEPAIRTAIGIPAIYFKGIAIPSRARKEMPSIIPIMRRRSRDFICMVLRPQK